MRPARTTSPAIHCPAKPTAGSTTQARGILSRQVSRRRGTSGLPDANYQAYDDDSIDAFARMTKVYKALGFYRRELTRAAAERGWPLVRHLLLEYPEDPESWAVDDEFMLGSELLVAPVKNKCFTWPVCPYDKEVYLPPGRWVHLWSGEALGEAGKGSRVTVKAPIGEPAVFYRQGSEVGATFVKNLRAAGIEVH